MREIMYRALRMRKLALILVLGLFFFGYTYLFSAEAGLAGLWKFEEGVGTVAKDYSGRGNDGAINGATRTKGKSGYTALWLDGINDYVDCGNIGNIKTIEYWIRPNSINEHVLDLDGGTHYIDHNNRPVGFTNPTVYVDGEEPEGLDTELITNQVDRDFAGGSSNWKNAGVGSFDDTNDLTATASVIHQYFYLEATHFGGNLTVGKTYKLEFDCIQRSVSFNIYLQSGGGFMALGATANGHNCFIFTPTGLGTGQYLQFLSNLGTADCDFDNFSLKEEKKEEKEKVLGFVPDGEWHHVAITTDTIVDAISVTLGKVGINYFNGLIDEVAFYDRVLSASEIKDHYEMGALIYGDGRTSIDLSGIWKLNLTDSEEIIKMDDDKGIINGYWKKDYDAGKWKNVKVPHNWFWEGLSKGKCTVGWYQKKVIAPKEYQGRQALLHFEGLSYESDIWVNGQKVGNHKSMYTPFEFDVTEYIDWGAINVISIRCSFYPEAWHIVEFPTPGKGRAGIRLKPSLNFVPSVYIKQVCINPKVASSEINVEYWVMNNGKKGDKLSLGGLIEPFAGKSPGMPDIKEDLGVITVQPGLNKLQFTMKLKEPVCWSPDNPYLYNLSLVLLNDSGRVIDCTRTRFGFREFTARGNTFYLNGKPIFLFGVESLGVNGRRWGGSDLTEEKERALTRDQFMKTKEHGVNLLRGWYACPSPAYVYEVADEVGILYYEEWEQNRSDDRGIIKQEIEEMEAWVLRNWNSPSIVMLSFFNENWGGGAITDKLYHNLKPVVGDRLLLCASSGMWSWPGVPGIPVKTDIIDMHLYIGDTISCQPAYWKFPWTYMEDGVQTTWDGVVKLYGGDPNKPLIIGESPNNALLGWYDPKIIAPGGKVTPESYVTAAKLPYMGHNLESTTLREALEYWGSSPEERSLKVKRSVESLRKVERVRGIVINNLGPPLITKVVYKPTFICSGIFDTNLFSGDTLSMDLHVINDCQDDKKDTKAVIEIISRDGRTINSDSIILNDLKGSSRKKVPYTYKIPDNFPTGLYDIKLYLYSGDKILSNNYYDFYVLNKKDLQPVVTDRKVSLLVLPGNEIGTTKTEEMLNIMTVKYKTIPVSGHLYDLLESSKTDVLIIPMLSNEKINNWLELNPDLEVIGKAIRVWVKGGGKILFLEQTIKQPLPWVREWKIMDGSSNYLVDMAVPEHPVYKGMTQRNFDTWNTWEGRKGTNTRFLISPMTENVLASVSANSTDEMVMAIVEAKVGKGLIVGSQLEATMRFMKDSCATKYLYNLISYVLGNEVYAGARELTGGKEKSYLLDLDKCFYVDLKPYVNRGFKDEVDADKEGGWSDQGENDLRHIPVGEDNPEKKYWQLIYRQEIKDKQIFLGVPFVVIDPAGNDDKSCIVLAGGPRPYFPAEVKGIKINSAASKLYFLHTSVWCTGGLIAKYIIHYSDGTSETINLIGGKNIADWWGPKDIEEALVAWADKHPVTDQYVGVYLMEWNNPNPAKVITSVDFISSKVAVPILIAITGVK